MKFMVQKTNNLKMNMYNKFEDWLYAKAFPTVGKIIEYTLMAALGYGVIMAIYNVIAH